MREKGKMREIERIIGKKFIQGEMPTGKQICEKQLLKVCLLYTSDVYKRQVVDLNLFGTVLPTMVFVDVMAKNKKGAIVNFLSLIHIYPCM